MNKQPTDLTKPVHLAVEGAVAVMTLSRAPVNAIDDTLTNAVEDALAELGRQDRLALLRIRSDQKVFCAGADLRMIADRFGTEEGTAAMLASVRRFQAIFDRIAALPMVTLAEIQGHALGGGLELALACDLRIAAHEAKIGLPEVNVGLIPGAGGTQRLTALCGPGVASRLILTGEVVGGEAAERLGLVQWSSAAAELADTANIIAKRIAQLSPEALRAAKECIRLAMFRNAVGFGAEIDGIRALMDESETARRIAAFVAGSGR